MSKEKPDDTLEAAKAEVKADYEQAFKGLKQAVGGYKEIKNERIAILEAENARLRDAIGLAACDVLFFSKGEENEVQLHLFCSDTFSYATADGEPIRWEDVPVIADLYAQQDWPGIIELIGKRRDAQPIPPVAKNIQVTKGRLSTLEAAIEEARAPDCVMDPAWFPRPCECTVCLGWRESVRKRT